MEAFGSFRRILKGVYELEDDIFRARVWDATYLVRADKIVAEKVGREGLKDETEPYFSKDF